MAMARCRECNKKISTEADTCPNCGAKEKDHVEINYN